MLRKTVARTLVVAALAVGALAFPTPTRAVTFTRMANTAEGRTLLDPGPLTMKVGTEAWHETGRDMLPFDYEQGVATDGRGNVFFNSRGMLYRTTTGCPSPDDDAVPCYDVLAENRTPINSAEGGRGFNHVGDTSAGRRGPAAGYLFTPLEKSPGNGIDRIFKIFDATTLEPAGTLDLPGPFSHHSWVVVDPSGRYMLNADATIRKLEVYRINRNPKPASPAERIFLTRAKELDVAIDEGIPADIGPTGCSFRDDLSLYCADWQKNEAKWDEGTDVYRIRLRSPIGGAGNRGSASKAFSYAINHRTPSITYGLEGEGLTFYPRAAGGPNELHVLIRGEHLASTFLLHLAPGAS